MPINVYWANCEKEWMLAKEPESVLKNFLSKGLFDRSQKTSNVSGCPAFISSLKNIYSLKSIYQYDFSIDENHHISTKIGDQKFFDEHVLIRMADKKMFSFAQKYIFFTDAPSLEMTAGEYPFMEDNNITQRCVIIPGKYDIAKRFREIEFAFYLKNHHNQFKIDYDEVYSYIRFHTEEKINFIQFRFNDKLQKYSEDCINMNNNMPLKTLDKFYFHFKTKNLIMKEIKNNLLI